MGGPSSAGGWKSGLPTADVPGHRYSAARPTAAAQELGWTEVHPTAGYGLTGGLPTAEGQWVDWEGLRPTAARSPASSGEWEACCTSAQRGDFPRA